MNETLASLLSTRAAERPDHPFVSFPDGETTYRELHDRATALARGLLKTGLNPGAHVGILMTNCMAYQEIFFAIHLAGGVAVPFNARFRHRELAFVIAHSDIEILITTDLADEHTDFTALLNEALPDLASQNEDLHLNTAPRLRRIYLHGTKQAPPIQPLHNLVNEGHATDPSAITTAWSTRKTSDTAVLLYTSGTTADPKGCEITHEALIRSWSAYADLVGFEPDQSMWTPCPFFHVGGIGVTVSALARGATMMSMNWFEPEAALAHIEKRQAEHLFPAFPPLTLGLLRTKSYDPARWTFARTILNVAPADTQRVIEGLLPKETVLLTDFGMTEGSGMITVTPRDAAGEDRLTRNGTPLPGIEVRVTDPDNPKTMQPNGVPGEIQFRGINAFHGYYKNAKETAATIIDGGWVRTGDQGSLDSRGQLLFLGRLKDVLKVGGENVSPLEVEALLSTHPAVNLAQVVGRPSERYGEEPVAFVELIGGHEATPAELIAFCAANLASYKVPREVRFVTEWPMSATKIQKFRLRDLLTP